MLTKANSMSWTYINFHPLYEQQRYETTIYIYATRPFHQLTMSGFVASLLTLCVMLPIISDQYSTSPIRLILYELQIFLSLWFYKAPLSSHLYSSVRQLDVIMYKCRYNTTGGSWFISFMASIWICGVVYGKEVDKGTYMWNSMELR